MHKLGIIVPYRNRPEQLSIFKKTIKTYLKEIDYELIVVEQVDSKDFNRGKLLNIGFIEASLLNCDYVVFHDVDLIPINADYSYSPYPVHLIGSLDTPEGFKRETFDTYFGGVTLFPSKLFKVINGYTNEYYGWGFEDDNLLLRCIETSISLDSKTITQDGRNGIGLQFNGKNSFVAIPNIIKKGRDVTLMVNFSIDEIKTNKKEITDIFSIFSIPGFDTTLTYNSFRNFTFQFWKKDLSSMSITSDHLPDGTYTATIVIENRAKDKCATFYLNGNKIGSLQFDKIKPLDSKYIYLGVGDPERETKNNWFFGKINTFAVYEHALPSTTISRLYRNVDKSLFSFECYDKLNLYYDSKYVRENTILDLSGNNNNGYVSNCTQVITKISRDITVPLPHRRQGEFRALPHDENGYTDGYWLNWKSRENQIDYYDKYYKKSTNLKEDGITNCEYKIISKEVENNNTYLKVEL